MFVSRSSGDPDLEDTQNGMQNHINIKAKSIRLSLLEDEISVTADFSEDKSNLLHFSFALDSPKTCSEYEAKKKVAVCPRHTGVELHFGWRYKKHEKTVEEEEESVFHVISATKAERIRKLNKDKCTNAMKRQVKLDSKAGVCRQQKFRNSHVRRKGRGSWKFLVKEVNSLLSR